MRKNYIEITGARENNLKNIDVKIPKNEITVFTGVSGSGKSSIVFETIAQEAGRQLNETFSNFVRLYLPKYSQPDADTIQNLAMAIVIDQKRLGGNSRSTLGTITDINPLFRLLFSRFGQPYVGYSNSFSFNDPSGMCPECEGIGKIITLDINAALDPEKSLNEGAILLPGFTVNSWQWKSYADTGFFDLDKKIKDYTTEEYNKLVYAKSEKYTMNYKGSDFNTTYEGIAEKFTRVNIKTDREKSKASQKKFEQYTTNGVCPSCNGKRYHAKTLSATINGYNIFDLTQMQLNELVPILKAIAIPDAAPLINSIITRLNNLIDIGLDYVNLNRETTTLSGGESQRVKMVKHLTSSLTDVLYILDEPSIGLHPRDVHRLNELLVKIRDKGNTVIVVEHDPDVIKIADHIIDVGPRAGRQGGEIVFSGTYEELQQANTLTAQYLAKSLQLKSNPISSNDFLESSISSRHNLKNVRLRVPQGVFTVVTGVAGSGKSTLVNDVFVKDYPTAIRIDQSAVSANIRSNPATYTGVMDYIRKCFAEANQVSAGLFSYNSEGGCETCKGTGTVEINLSFMDTQTTVCSDCEGKRFKKEVLQYQYKDKNIVDIMNMTIAEAVDFFEAKEIKKKLTSMVAVGIQYMTLGQPLNTLSGGECQRLKLAKELNKKGNIYILDEPTTGLHMSDIKNIITIIEKLVKKGNTVIAIEHNLDIIKNADWIIDLGPDGGSKGGEILYEGIPANINRCSRSVTANYLV
jgi:excinuclease UvrABC ATPase subunit